MNHLSPAVVANLVRSDLQGGVYVLEHPEHVNAEIKAKPVLPIGRLLRVRTRNTLYTIYKIGPAKFTISGHGLYCPEPTLCSIHGSTWGGSMLKVGFIGRGMHLEFSTDKYRMVTTSAIQSIVEEAQSFQKLLKGLGD
jgi:hypothetical protein